LFDINDYKRTLLEDPDFFDWYDLFNNGGTISKEKERDLMQKQAWVDHGVYE